MKQKVEIKCKGSAILGLTELNEFQGNLKTLSDINYNKFKNDLLELGFSEPVSVWLDGYGHYNILNGHQRLAVLKRMKEEGYEIPNSIPVSEVFADSIEQAKLKVLALTSSFGQITDEGFLEFIEENNIDISSIKDKFEFNDINIDLIEFEPEDSINPKDHWKGMPDFEQEAYKPYSTIIFRFKTKEDLETFSHLISQNLNEKTKSAWYPKLQHGKEEFGGISNQEYSDE